MAGLIAPFTVRTYTPSACAGRAYSKDRKAHMVNLKMAVIRSLFNVTLGTEGVVIVYALYPATAYLPLSARCSTCTFLLVRATTTILFKIKYSFIVVLRHYVLTRVVSTVRTDLRLKSGLWITQVFHGPLNYGNEKCDINHTKFANHCDLRSNNELLCARHIFILLGGPFYIRECLFRAKKYSCHSESSDLHRLPRRRRKKRQSWRTASRQSTL